MTKIDYNLVYLQSENARITLKELSKNLRKSPQRLKYTINSLKKEEILRDPYCIFDYSYFGLILFRVYFRGAYISEQEKANILIELNSNPYIVSMYELSGEFDLIVEFASPNPSKFNKELKNLSVHIPTLHDYKIVLNLVSYICPRHYLTESENLQSFNVEKIIGGDRERELFNPNEMVIMKNLLLNPTIRYTDLAKKSSLNVKTGKSILINLRTRKIVRGFRYIINTNKLGIHKFRLFLRLHNVSPERDVQLIEYILKIKEVVQINKTVGDWDMELDIEALDKGRIRQLVTQLREEFKEIIERFNLIEFYDYYKRSYLPLFLFNEEIF